MQLEKCSLDVKKSWKPLSQSLSVIGYTVEVCSHALWLIQSTRKQRSGCDNPTWHRLLQQVRAALSVATRGSLNCASVTLCVCSCLLKSIWRSISTCIQLFRTFCSLTSNLSLGKERKRDADCLQKLSSHLSVVPPDTVRSRRNWMQMFVNENIAWRRQPCCESFSQQ